MADATPGAGNSGIINVYIVNHSHSVNLAATALTEADGDVFAHFGAGASLNAPLEGEVPYDTEFDIIIQMQYSNAHAYNSSTSGFDVSYVRALMTNTDLGIGADTEMTKPDGSGDTPFCTISGTDHAIIQFYLDDDGDGYTMAHGETFNTTSLKLQAFY